MHTKPRTLDLLDAADDEAVDALHAFELRRWELDEPHDPPPTRRQTLADATRSYSPGRRETWLAHGADGVIGTVRLTYFAADNTHAVETDVAVDPSMRRQGLGMQLLRQAAARAREEGRRLLMGAAVEGAAGAAFAAAAGAQHALVEVRRRQDLSALDPARCDQALTEAWHHAQGYELLRWSGSVADDLLEPVAAVVQSLNDAPLDDLDYEDEVWDGARYRGYEAWREARGDRWHVIVARHRESGELAGLTDVGIEDGGGPLAYQGDTVVTPQHRGHRLGAVLKLEMMSQLRAIEPQVRFVDTWNAASNPYMIAINEAIGYQVLESYAEWQLESGSLS